MNGKIKENEMKYDRKLDLPSKENTILIMYVVIGVFLMGLLRGYSVGHMIGGIFTILGLIALLVVGIHIYLIFGGKQRIRR